MRVDQIGTNVEQNFDWASLIEIARAHGMMPFLYRGLNAARPARVPGAILDELQDHFYAGAGRNLHLTSHLLGVLRSLDEHGIEAVPFKGPALAASIYGNIAFREFGDLDILVRKRDVSSVADLLAAQGFRRLVSYCQHEAAERHFFYNHGFSREDVILEVHWTVAERFFGCQVDLERLWKRLTSVSLAGTTVPNLAPEDSMLVLSVHGARHCWERLAWICDVAQLARAFPRLDWEDVMRRARTFGGERILLLSVLLAHELLDVGFPEEVLHPAQADRSIRTLAAVVYQRLARRDAAPLDDRERRFFHVGVRERVSDRIRYLARVAATPKGAVQTLVPGPARACLYALMAVTPNERDWAFLPLPSSLRCLYYLIRPVRLLGKHALSALPALHRREGKHVAPR